MKKIIALCLVLMLLLPAQVFAHSKLTVSSPENNATLETSPAIISMEFNTDIASLSTFTLENEAGNTVAVEQINVEGAKLSGVPTEPLINGNYTVKWTIIGADGHTINGNFAFRVIAPEVTASPTAEVEVTPTPSIVPSATPTPVANTEVIESEASSNSSVMPYVLVAIIIALAVTFATRRKKK